MLSKRFLLKSEEDLISLGGRLGQTIRRDTDPRFRNMIVLLSGTIGVGKSCFARGCIRSAVGSPDLVVPSPTFVLLNSYQDGLVVMHHLDLYRLGNDASQLGVLDLPGLHASGGCMLIEWPALAQAVLQPFLEKRLCVDLEADASEQRIVTITGPSNWVDRI